MALAWIVSALALHAATALAHPLARAATEPDPDNFVNVSLAGKTYTNKESLSPSVVFPTRSDLLPPTGSSCVWPDPSNFTESTGDTLGGIGSGVALKRGSFIQQSDGTFTGTIVVQPDRGFNVDGTIDYQARHHNIDFVLSPYYGDDDLDFDDALETLQLTYRDTLLYTERNNQKTTGLDATGVRPAALVGQVMDPPLPIAPSNSHLTIDAEGLVINSDGTFWTSDEYGPYIYLMSAEGSLLMAIEPPNAILPMVNGQIDFTSVDDPDTGRSGNQGFEGLTADPTGNTLYAMLQSATMQDGGGDKDTERYTRLLAWDVSSPLSGPPPLIGEWVVPLPLSSKGKTFPQSEIHFVSEDVFLVLSRDGDGHGGDDNNSAYKQADLFDISGATDIHGTKFDDPSNPVAPNGKLDKSVTPAQYVGFVSFIDDDQLARFGLHNGKPADQTLIDAKWESLALAPCNDPSFPDDYFLFTVADNDYITTDGSMLGQPYDAGLDNDNQFMVFRVTLPGATVNIA
ncbi:esterase-like activity of phytase-domain-containing protein [Epithele typhae]|uniref:esterase-like activity of phytase-domain-containing protein n=1 Tax=Epithele typhae TaxID=378194 RepID=UPI00200856DF|nr:esterase-like activity of phytase-domain-containing protein [Epithele typhae]KAH9919965.1 esterase-like activity of phytase-domain-containing protein [Epithele typhae]